MTSNKRNLIVLVAAQVAAVSAMGIVIPLIPFFVRELGIADRAAVERWSGLIFSGPFLAAALMSPVWGWLGDRYGHKKMVVRAIIGLAAVHFLLVWVETPLQFWLIRLVQGTVTGFIPAAMALISASTPQRELPDAMGKLTASASAGRLIGPAAGGLLAGLLPFRQIFLLVGGILAVVAVAVVVYLEDPPVLPAHRRHSARDTLAAALSDRRIGLAMLGLLLTMAAISMTMPIFPLYIEDLVGAGPSVKPLTGIGFAVVAGFTLLAAAALGRVTDRLGLKPVLAGSLMLCAAALALHNFVATVPAMLAVRALLGLSVAGVAPILHSMVSRRAPEGMRGGIQGFASMATILGFFVGPFCGGWLSNAVGIPGVFWTAAATAAATGLGIALLARRYHRDRRLVQLAEPTPR
jgi:DHA1 family multidrug resistance protein-like MFS transporter